MRWFLVWLLVSWLAGVVGGVVGLQVYAVVLVGLALAHWGWRYGLRGQVLVAGVGLLLLGVMHGGAAVEQDEGTQCVQGRVAEEALVEEIFQQAESRSQYVVTLDGGCTLLVTVPVWPRYEVGEQWRLAGKVQGLGALPAELEGYGTYLRRRGIYGTVLYPEVVVEAGGSWLGAGRRWIARRVNAVLAEPEASVVRAMLWGERGAVSGRIEEQLTAAGVRHVLAISGLHVSMVVGGMTVAARQLRLARWGELAVLLGLLWGYVWLVGSPVSAVRAGWFWTIFLAGWRGRVLVSWLTALLATLVVLVTWRPEMVLDVGLQLSVAAVAGIALAVRVADASWPGRVGFWGKSLAGAGGALAATGPITATVFGEVSWVGLGVNVLVLPVLPLFLGLALGAMSLGLLWQPLGLVAGAGVRGVWWYVERVTAVATSWPGAYVREASVPDWWLIWWYSLMVTGAVWWLAKRTGSWRVIWE